jgi:hypothetical protein
VYDEQFAQVVLGVCLGADLPLIGAPAVGIRPQRPVGRRGDHEIDAAIREGELPSVGTEDDRRGANRWKVHRADSMGSEVLGAA